MMRALVLAVVCAACRPAASDGRTTLVFSGSAVGLEGQVFDRQLARFAEAHPALRVVRQATPDDADQRHQLYVQWLNAGASVPDVLQLDVVWTPEFAAARWITSLDSFAPDTGDIFSNVLAADRFADHLYALPLFVDVGALYWRKDLMTAPPATLDELAKQGTALMRDGRVQYGYLWQGARYEGLVTVFLEHLGAFGGVLLDAQGNVRVDSPAGIRALTFMRDSLESGLVPKAALAWQEEPVRFTFQNGEAAFMRNWPYAYPLLQEGTSRVAGKVGIATLPAIPEGHSVSALGGARLAINANSAHPREAYELVRFLTAPEQQLERARLAGQFPARRSLYERDDLGLVVPVAEAKKLVENAVPRPVTPLYAELSSVLQIRLHAALTGQEEPDAALARAAGEMREVLRRLHEPPRHSSQAILALVLLLLAVVFAGFVVWRRVRSQARPDDPSEERSALQLAAPAFFIIACVGLAPLGWTAWESLHEHDLRLPWLGRTFIGFANYHEVLTSPRARLALQHTAFFVVTSVISEILLGMLLALVLNHITRGRGIVRATVLLPWAMPTVVAALVWQFMFADAGIVNAILVELGVLTSSFAWFASPTFAWLPLLLADIWKTTPFVALLLLAGLQTIDPRLYEAARTDGASDLRQFIHVTLPLLRPALLVVLVFRTLDAFRIFDLVYVLTGGGPGTATEPIALYTFSSLLQYLRFGYGSALSMLIFVVVFVLALSYVRLLGKEPTG